MSAPHMKHRKGRPCLAEGMSILTHEIEEVAEAIKLRILSRKGTWEVHAGTDGRIFMDDADCPRHAKGLPDSWLVGTYTNKAHIEVIEEDLCERRAELLQARKAA